MDFIISRVNILLNDLAIRVCFALLSESVRKKNLIIAIGYRIVTFVNAKNYERLSSCSYELLGEQCRTPSGLYRARSRGPSNQHRGGTNHRSGWDIDRIIAGLHNVPQSRGRVSIDQNRGASRHNSNLV